jgi:hypothetical protein
VTGAAAGPGPRLRYHPVIRCEGEGYWEVEMKAALSHLLLIVPALACDPGMRRAEAEQAEPKPMVAAAAAKAEQPAVELPLAEKGGSASAGGLTITAHNVLNPERAATEKENYWIQYQVYGEITNDTNETLETVSGRITFHDASGKMLGIDSIGTAVKQDVGDDTPGETIYASVHFVKPGQTVPFHFMRNLAAIKGEVASHELHTRYGEPAADPPDALAVGVKESFEGDQFMRKRMFEGTIRNDGNGGCRAPAFVVAFLDDAGKIASMESWDASDDLQKTLATGETIDFRGGAFVTGDKAWRENAPVKTWVNCQPLY